MTTLATGLVGAAVGGMVGAPGIGFSLGSALGQAFLGGRSGSHTYTHQEGSRLSDLKVQTSQVGMMIPMVYGTYRIAGNVIWATDIVETSSTTTQTQHLGGGGKGGHHHDNVVTQTTATYSYSANFALGLCQGVILGIRRIWADGKLIYNTSSTVTTPTFMSSRLRAKQIRLYTGTDDQLPDPLIEAHMGSGEVPAFRGLAYLVFDSLPLAEFGNRLPNITVEVVQVGEHFKNLSHPLTDIEKPLNEPFGALSRFDGGVIHCQIAGNGVNSPPERVDLDLNLNVIQRWKGKALKPNVTYRPIIKYMPNLFLASSGQWYDVVTGEYAPLETGLGLPQAGVYAHGEVYCVYKNFFASSATLVRYHVGSPYELPKTVLSRLPNLPQLLAQPNATLIDMDVQHGDVFATISDNFSVYLMAFDPVSAQRRKKWTLKLDEQSWGFRPIYQNRMAFMLSLNSTSTQALFTQQDHQGSRGFLVNLDFEADTLFPDPNETYRFDGFGQFCFLSDEVVYIASPSSSGQCNKASVRGLHAIEPTIPTLADMIENLCHKAGLGSNEFDVSEMLKMNQPVTGFVISQSAALRDSLSLLQQAYAFDIVESGFQLKFIPRGKNSEPIKIPTDDFAAEYGQTSPTLIETHSQSADLPQRVNVLFTDIHNDYQQGHQLAQRLARLTHHQNACTVELPIALTPREAEKIANRVLYKTWSQRTYYEFTLSRKYAYLDPGDLIRLGFEKDHDGVKEISCDARNDNLLRITSLAYGDPGLVKIKAVSEDRSMDDLLLQTTDTESDSTVTKNNTDVLLPSPSPLYLLDIPILQDTDDDAGFYASVSRILPEWPGAIVVQSTDDGQTFRELYSQNKAAIYGVTQNVLPSGKTTVFDEDNFLIVKLTSGELVSVSEMDLLNGANVALVGDEILQFQNAILQADGSYQLSRFLRGRRNTEWAVNMHQTHEYFILIDSSTLHRIKSPASEIGLTRIYKAITYGRSVSSSTPYRFVNTAKGKKPLSPVHIQGTRNTAGDLQITWIPRTRIQGAWRDFVDAPLDPEITGYQIDIVKNQTVIRTLSTPHEIATYTAEQQMADFGDQQKMVSLHLYAIGRTVGRGFPTLVTL